MCVKDEMNDPSPPKELSEVAELVDRRITSFLLAERKNWVGRDARLDEAVGYFQSVAERGGKRLRAGFCYWSWYGSKTAGGRSFDSASNEVSQIIDVCAALELLHTFALIQDDVMDDSSMRRGEPTVHREQAERLIDRGWVGEPRRFGESVAVLVGNLGHVYSDRLMQEAPLDARILWCSLKAELNLGQYLDIRSAAAGELDFETARRVAWFKSALYTICRPMQLGLAVSGLSTDEAAAQIDQFSDPLGRAFQLRDDVLGLFGDESRLGKPVGDDIRDAKATELVAFALEKADPAQVAILELMGRGELSQVDIGRVAEVIRATGALSYVDDEIKNLILSAESALGELPYSPVAKRSLLSLARYVANRNL